MVSRIFNPKFLLLIVAIISIIWVSPEYLYSQVTSSYPPTQTTKTASPKKTSAPQMLAQVTRPSTAPGKATIKTPSPAEQALTADFENVKRPTLIMQAVVLSLFALMPFIIMNLTSFLKIVVVLSLLRTALGVQQAPPNQIINGVAFMLTLYVMYPTMLKMYDISQDTINSLHSPESITSPESPRYIFEIANKTKEPLREFLKKNSLTKHQILFYRISYKVLPEQHKPDLKPDDFIILVPAYITSQLKDAFEIGVLIYIPFFVIDLVTSNILLAMGMMMLSPVTISMPLKLFLLVMLDGWTLLIEGLVNTFVQ